MTDTVGFVPLPKSSANDSSSESPVLVLNAFAPRTIVDFGDVKAGKTKIACVTLVNPHAEDVTITTVKFPTTKTLVLHGYSAEESKSRAYKIPPNSCIDVRVAWTPQYATADTWGMRQTIELGWDRKRFVILLVGFVLDGKKKKAVKNLNRGGKKPEKPLDLSMGRDENDVNLRFKGVVNHTAKNKQSSVPVDVRPSKILGENQKSNIKAGSRTETGKRKLMKKNRPLALDLKSPIEMDDVKSDDLLPTPLRTEFGKESPFACMDTPNFIDTPAFVDTPRPNKRRSMRIVERGCKKKKVEVSSVFSDDDTIVNVKTEVEEQPDRRVTALKVETTPPASSLGDFDSPFQDLLTPFTPTPLPGLQQTPADIVPNVAPTPVQSMVKQECVSSSSGEGSAGTPGRKRRTWGAPEQNPLFTTPNVMTRGMLKKIGEESGCQQTFMECHTVAQTFMECHTMNPVDSVLENASPPRDRECDNPLSPGPAPFTPPNITLAEKKPGQARPVPNFNISPEDIGRTSGPLTATPLHPSMVLIMERKDDNLPCFDTSIIPHPSPVKSNHSQDRKKSEAFVIPAIETTSSTVNLSNEEVVVSLPLTRSGGKGSAEPRKKPPILKPALKRAAKTKAGPVIIKSRETRPKTAPGLARREGLRKNMTQDNARVSREPTRHPAKRRSVSAGRVESTPKAAYDVNVRPPKRKDLVTPTMGPPRSPGKRPRPLQRVVSVDESYREKRHRSCDVALAPKTPGNRVTVRRSIAPATGKRVKMSNSRQSAAMPRHPLALSSAKNIYFDEKWKMKQERAFTVWMNFYLAPPQGNIPPEYQNTREITKNAARKARKSMAPPDNATILARLQAERKLLHAERRASAMFQSPKMVEVLLKLEKEINEGGLTIRHDRKLDADLGLKDQLIDLLLCYNPVWLRLGLEVLYEEILPLSEHRDLPGLVSFLNSRFVNNPVIALQYAHSTVPGSYGAGYEGELRRFTLKKFLMLVLLLDMAKTNRVIDCDPCLFCLKSPYKTSRSILISFSNAYLGGEGDITKHLGYIGYTVKHEQKHIEEFDYLVKRIESELRDGIRLTRLVEIITETSLTDKLRTPAVSRLQKMHNVGLVLTQLQEEGVKLDNVPGGPIVTKSVVDGNQNLTLALIWGIIYQYSITKILAIDQLKAEVKILREILSRRKHPNPSAEEKDDDYVLGLPGRRLSVDERSFFNSEVLATLLDWCKIVCSYYDVPVDNFTVSFSDGRVLCLLVHHYHPELLPLSRIRMQTSLSHQLMELNASRDFLSDSRLDPDLHRDNEKENFRALADAMKGLNEVPYMITPGDMLGTIPDEKVVVTFVSYLCAALVDISQDFRAAQKIQRAWRRHKFFEVYEEMKERRRAIIKVQALARALMARRQLEELKLNREAIIAKRKEYAASRIQLKWRSYTATKDIRADFIKKRGAAKTIQKFYKVILEERWRDRIGAAKLIQKTWRCHRDRSKYLRVQQSTVKIQSAVRMYICRRDFIRRKSAVECISNVWRSYSAMKKNRHDFLNKRSAAVCVQKYLRGYLARNTAGKIRSVIKIQGLYRGFKARKDVQLMKSQRELIQTQIKSSIMIQSAIRGFLARRDSRKISEAVVKIQQHYRSYLITRYHRQNFLLMRQHTVFIQSRFRGYLARKELSLQQEAATKIQAAFRGCLARSHIQLQNRSAVLIQRAYKGFLQMKSDQALFEESRTAAVKIQATWKMCSQQRKYWDIKEKTVQIQAWYRMHRQAQAYKHQRQSCIKIQCGWRGYLQMKSDRAFFEGKRAAAVKIQSYWRMVQVIRIVSEQSQAATQIQSSWRMYSDRSAFLRQKDAAVRIQRMWRSGVVRGQIRDQKVRVLRTLLMIQSHYRGLSLRSHVTEQQRCALKLQAFYRGYRVRQEIARQHVSAGLIQACYRGYQDMKLLRARFITIKLSAIVIQSHVRSYLVRRDISRATEAAVAVQAHYRGYCVRKSYLKQRNAACLIQEHTRAWIEGRKKFETYQQIRRATILMQACYRGARTRRHLHKQIVLATKIQATWRMYVTRTRYLTQRHAAVKIQATWRMYSQKHKFNYLKAKTVQIQAWLRMHRQVQAYKHQRQSCIQIQCSWKGYLARKQYQSTRNAVIRIQAAVRGLSARRILSGLQSLEVLRRRLLDHNLSIAQVRDLDRKLSEILGS